MVLLLIAPLYFMIALPGGIEKFYKLDAQWRNSEYIEPEGTDPSNSFFGEKKENESFSSMEKITTEKWGGDIGWYLAFIAFFLMLMSTILIFISKDGETEIESVSKDISQVPQYQYVNPPHIQNQTNPNINRQQGHMNYHNTHNMPNNNHNYPTQGYKR